MFLLEGFDKYQRLQLDKEVANREPASIDIAGAPVTAKYSDPFLYRRMGSTGRLYLVKGDWNKKFTAFDKGEHDDRVDAASGMYGIIRFCGR